MSASLALMLAADASPLDRVAVFQALRKMVLNSVASEHSKRNYAKALDEVFALCEERKQPLSRARLMEYRAAMLGKKLSASTVNVRLSAVRKLIGEAQRNGIIGAEEAANLAGVPNLSRKGTRVGNWLTREQAKELFTVPDRSKIKGKRDYAILALLLGCALRRQELASLDVDGIEMREGRWVLPDLCGKGGRVRTVAIPLWVKHGIDAWMIAAKIEHGRLLRPLSKSGKLTGDELKHQGPNHPRINIERLLKSVDGKSRNEHQQPHELTGKRPQNQRSQRRATRTTTLRLQTSWQQLC
jgi:site-specific recombinase XerC